MSMAVEESDGIIVLTPFGNEIDGTIDTALDSHLSRGARYAVVDMSFLPDLTLPALRAFLRLVGRLRAKGGKLVFCQMSQSIRDHLDACDILRSFTVYESKPKAVDALRLRSSLVAWTRTIEEAA